MAEQTQDPDAVLARYADGPDQLEAAIAGLTDANLDVAQTSDTWTIRQYTHHVVDGDDLWKTCIKAALGNSTDVFSLQWYWDKSQDTWAESWDYAGRAIEPSLVLFHANPRHVVQLLQQIPDAWERRVLVRWPNGQEAQLTVGYVVKMQADHVMSHINDILTIRRTYNLQPLIARGV